MSESSKMIQSLLENAHISIKTVNCTKVSPTWRDLDFLSTTNRLYYILEGEGWVKIGEEEYRPRPGQLVLMPAGIVQSYSAASGDTYRKYWCHFSANVGELSLFQALRLPHVLDVPDPAGIEASFAELLRQYQAEDWSGVMRAKGVLYAIIGRYLEWSAPERISLHTTGGMDKMAVVVQYVENHIREELTVEKLARLVHFHPNYFIQMFKNTLGEPPIQYINKLRIQRAKSLLLHSALSVSEIASEVGLQPLYFSRLFKSYTGLPPSEFRAVQEAGALLKR